MLELLKPEMNSLIKKFDYYFSWKTNEEKSLNFQFMIAREKDFSNPIVNTMVIEKSEYLCPLLLDKDIYYWKVRIQYDDFSLSSWSKTGKFEISQSPLKDQYSTGHLTCYMKP